jgi:hypothetical protein
MTAEFGTGREIAILAALGLISNLLCKRQNLKIFFIFALAGNGQAFSSQEIVSHVPTSILMTLPILAKLYDRGFYCGQEQETFKQNSLKVLVNTYAKPP